MSILHDTILNIQHWERLSLSCLHSMSILKIPHRATEQINYNSFSFFSPQSYPHSVSIGFSVKKQSHWTAMFIRCVKNCIPNRRTKSKQMIRKCILCRHDMELFSALLTICKRNPSVVHRTKAHVMRSLDFFMYALTNGRTKSGVADDFTHHEAHVPL